MTREEKEILAREVLKRNGYTEGEIRQIIRLIFGDKKPSPDG